MLKVVGKRQHGPSVLDLSLMYSSRVGKLAYLVLSHLGDVDGRRLGRLEVGDQVKVAPDLVEGLEVGVDRDINRPQALYSAGRQ